MADEGIPEMKDATLVEGTIEKIRGHSFFTVRLDNGSLVLAKVAGRSRRMARDLFPGVGVRVRVSPYDPYRGRIIELTSS